MLIHGVNAGFFAERVDRSMMSVTYSMREKPMSQGNCHGFGLARLAVAGLLIVLAGINPVVAQHNVDTTVTFEPIPVQFIAALGQPGAKFGVGAENWGLWRHDPGPRGVWLKLFPVLQANKGIGPGGWQFDDDDWWLDENGLIMEKPDFPVPAGRYLVTGEREVTTMLTVHPKDADGSQRWELADDATLFDVTHMPCRSARYTAGSGEGTCSPANANPAYFKVAPGSVMPAVTGCNKQDYAVLIVIGKAVES